MIGVIAASDRPLPQPALRFDANALTWQGATGTQAADQNGNAVRRWGNSTGASRGGDATLLLTTAAAAPPTISTDPDGRRGVTFGDAAQPGVLQVAQPTTLAQPRGLMGRTVLLVANVLNNNARHFPLSSGRVGGQLTGAAGTAAGAAMVQFQFSSGALLAYIGTAANAQRQLIANVGAIPTHGVVVVAIAWDPVNGRMGVQPQQGQQYVVTEFPAVDVADVTHDIVIGGWEGTDGRWRGYLGRIHEVALYDDFLSADAVGRISDALVRKWGL